MTQEESEEQSAPRSDRTVDRRRFLDFAWKALALGLVVEAGWTTYDVLTPRPAGGFGGLLEAGPAGAFPEGTARYVAEGRFYVVNVEGSLVALYQKCTHLGCKVPFCESSGRFECPCHGSIFNLKGEYVAGPAPRGMDRFPIELDGETVLVDTGTVVEGPPKGERTLEDEPRGPSCLEDQGEAPLEGAIQHEGGPQGAGEEETNGEGGT